MTKSKKKGKGRPQSAPNRRIIKGNGNYKVALNNLTTKMDGLLKKIPKGAFAKGGGAVGGMLGGTMGAALGKRMGRGLAAITGYGDYQVRSNSLSTVSTSVDMVPQFARTDHSVRVCHREFVGDLKVPANPDEFNNNFVQLINPANTTLFPWLSRMATLYTQYKIHGMVITYKTMSSNYSAGGGPLGTVIIATNYNVNDQAFTTKVQMENSEFAVSCNPSTSLIHAIECDPKFSGLQTLYVLDPETQQPGAISDPRFYHYGKLQIATSGLPGAYNNTMGELWISYDIELMKPVIGKDEAPGPGPTPGPDVYGTVVNSQPDGQIALTDTAEYAQTSLSQITVLTQDDPDVLFAVAPNIFEPEKVTGDLGLWRTLQNTNAPIKLLELEAGFSTLRFHRSGTYNVVVNCVVTRSVNTGSDKGPVLTADQYVSTTNNFTPTITNVGAGVTNNTVCPQNWWPFHWGHAGGPVYYQAGALSVSSPTFYKIGDLQWWATVTVSGLDDATTSDDRYVEISLPYCRLPSIAVGGAASRAHDQKLFVGWISTVRNKIVT